MRLLQKKGTRFNFSRDEADRVILFDRFQPVRNGDGMQSTNSIHRPNNKLGSKRDFQHVEKETLKRMADTKLVYADPNARFSFQKEFFNSFEAPSSRRYEQPARPNASRRQQNP